MMNPPRSNAHRPLTVERTSRCWRASKRRWTRCRRPSTDSRKEPTENAPSAATRLARNVSKRFLQPAIALITTAPPDDPRDVRPGVQRAKCTTRNLTDGGRHVRKTPPTNHSRDFPTYFPLISPGSSTGNLRQVWFDKGGRRYPTGKTLGRRRIRGGSFRAPRDTWASPIPRDLGKDVGGLPLPPTQDGDLRQPSGVSIPRTAPNRAVQAKGEGSTAIAAPPSNLTTLSGRRNGQTTLKRRSDGSSARSRDRNRRPHH